MGKSTTLWLFNIAMENGPFIDDFPIKTSTYGWFSMAMLNNQVVSMAMASSSQTVNVNTIEGISWQDQIIATANQ